jgi:8-oxo-dGTP diphosphatase
LDDLAVKFPHLFQEVIWPWGPTRARFELMKRAPVKELISNINLVPCVGDQWIVLRLQDGSWEIPGGTLEPGENDLDTLSRELMEEAGARLVSFHLIGAWHCHSLADQPYRPHLPFPEHYRVVGWGEIEIVQPPKVPPEGEEVSLVARLPIDVAVTRFTALERHDLAELYQLAALLRAV